ncbi:MAG: xanthine phosphoribosyltransferase [Coprobacillaceae bacterium]
MEILKEKIAIDGEIIMPNILKVDGFLNHQIDSKLFKEIGKTFKERFKDKKVTKVLTIEASGIALALAVAYEFDCVPVVFAKKGSSKTINNDVYTSKIHSFTKNLTYDAIIKKEYLTSDDHVLVIDDFLANGQAMLGLLDMCEQAQAQVSGIGIVIEKGFQDGRQLIEEKGYQVESLAIIKEFKDGRIIFK